MSAGKSFTSSGCITRMTATPIASASVPRLTKFCPL
jgi:hypothetical protein